MQKVNSNSEPSRKIYDFFIHFNRKDSEDFANSLKKTLKKKGFFVLLSNQQDNQDETALSEIQDGVSKSLITVLIFSKHFFEEWTEQKTKAILTDSKLQITVPIWYKVDANFVIEKAPFFSDLNAIMYDEIKPNQIHYICEQLISSIRPEILRFKILYFYNKCMFKKFPNDPDLKLAIATANSNLNLIKEAFDEGANPNGLDTDSFNKYARESSAAGCLEEFSLAWLCLNDKMDDLRKEAIKYERRNEINSQDLKEKITKPWWKFW